MGRSAKQLDRWEKDIKLVVPVGEVLSSSTISKILFDFDWSQHQKNLGRGTRSKRLFPTVMEVVAVLKRSEDFEMIREGSDRNCWRRIS